MNAADFDKLTEAEKEHFFHCPKCGQFVDRRELRDGPLFWNPAGTVSPRSVLTEQDDALDAPVQ
jgi:hypothetical protein